MLPPGIDFIQMLNNNTHFGSGIKAGEEFRAKSEFLKYGFMTDKKGKGLFELSKKQ